MVLDYLFKQTASGAGPTSVYISLHSADPGDDGSNELASSGAYARAAYATDTDNTTHVQWSAVDTATNPPYSRMTNLLPVDTFAEATADWNGGFAIQWFGAWTLSAAGVYLFGGQIGGGAGVVVLSGVTLVIPAGNLYHELD